MNFLRPPSRGSAKSTTRYKSWHSGVCRGLGKPPPTTCRNNIRAPAEKLDAHRKRVLAEHPHLTLTGLYNVLEKLRAGTAPDALDTADASSTTALC